MFAIIGRGFDLCGASLAVVCAASAASSRMFFGAVLAPVAFLIDAKAAPLWEGTAVRRRDYSSSAAEFGVYESYTDRTPAETTAALRGRLADSAAFVLLVSYCR